MKSMQNILEKFDELIGNKMSGKELPGYIDGLDNLESEKIKAFIKSEVEGMLKEIREAMQNDLYAERKVIQIAEKHGFDIK